MGLLSPRRSSAGRWWSGSQSTRRLPRRRRWRPRSGKRVTFGLWGILGFSGRLDCPSSLDKLESAQTGSSYTIRALLRGFRGLRLGEASWFGLVLGVLVCVRDRGRRGLDRLSFAFAGGPASSRLRSCGCIRSCLYSRPSRRFSPRLRLVWSFPALLWFGSGTGNGEPVGDAPGAGGRGATFALGVVRVSAALADGLSLRLDRRVRSPPPRHPQAPSESLPHWGDVRADASEGGVSPTPLRRKAQHDGTRRISFQNTWAPGCARSRGPDDGRVRAFRSSAASRSS